MKGEVIGINSNILTPTGGNIGIGFAIPSNMAKKVVVQLKDKGKVDARPAGRRHAERDRRACASSSSSRPPRAP